MKKEIKIGVLSLAVLVSAFFVLNFLRGRDVLNHETEYKAHFSDVEGLVASAPAFIKGFQAGHVTSVVYRPESDDFEVTCSVKKEFKIPEDSRMVIYATSIMGNKGVRLEPGTSSTMAAKGAILASGSEADLVSTLTSMLNPIVSKIGGTLDSLELVLHNVNAVLDDKNRSNLASSLSHLNATLASASQLAASLEGKSPEINTIVDNLKLLSDKLTPIAESAGATLSNIEGISAKLNDADLAGTVEKLGGAASTLDTEVKNISAPLDSLLGDVDSLVKAIKENPKKYIKITVF